VNKNINFFSWTQPDPTHGLTQPMSISAATAISLAPAVAESACSRREVERAMSALE